LNKELQARSKGQEAGSVWGFYLDSSDQAVFPLLSIKL